MARKANIKNKKTIAKKASKNKKPIAKKTTKVKKPIKKVVKKVAKKLTIKKTTKKAAKKSIKKTIKKIAKKTAKKKPAVKIKKVAKKTLKAINKRKQLPAKPLTKAARARLKEKEKAAKIRLKKALAREKAALKAQKEREKAKEKKAAIKAKKEAEKAKKKEKAAKIRAEKKAKAEEEKAAKKAAKKTKAPKVSKIESNILDLRNKFAAANTKSDFKVGDYAIYPSHGIGKITEIESVIVLGQDFSCYLMFFEKERLIIKVPVKNSESIGLRHLVSKEQMEEVFAILRSGVKKLKGMWSRRAQEYEAKINSGDILALSEVLRDLTRDVDDGERSYSERIIYETAVLRLAAEYAVIYNIDLEVAKEKVIATAKDKVNSDAKQIPDDIDFDDFDKEKDSEDEEDHDDDDDHDDDEDDDHDDDFDEDDDD